MIGIDFVYSRDCPHVGAARSNLLRALNDAGMAPRWREWLSDGADTPDDLRGLASPSIVVDGTVVDGPLPAEAACCRVYRDATGSVSSAPATTAIIAALGSNDRARPMPRTMSVMAAMPAVGAALVPKLTCAVCWPAYSGLLAALGIGFVDYTSWLLPIAVVSLILFLASLVAASRRSGTWSPLLLGLLGAFALLGGEFALGDPALTYAGAAGLVAATALSMWSRRTGAACAVCLDIIPEEVASEQKPTRRSFHGRLPGL